MELITTIIISLILLGLGVVFLRYGYSFFRILLFITVFITFGFLTFIITTTLLANPFLGVVVGFVIGLIAAALAYLFYKFAIALALGGLVYNLISLLLIQLNVWSWLIFIIAAFFAVVAFFFGLNEMFTRFYIIFITSLQGAYLFVVGLFLLFLPWSGITISALDQTGGLEETIRSLDPFWAITFWISLATAAFLGYVYQSRVYNELPNPM